MSAQQGFGIDIEGIVHGPRGVIFRNIEGLEVVIVVLDLRPFGHLVADAREQFLDALQGEGHGMQATRGLPPARQGDIDALPRQARLQCGGLQGLAPRLDGLVHLLLGLIHGLPGLGTRLRGQILELPQGIGEHALLAQILDAQPVQRRQVRGGGDLLHGLFDEWVQLHGLSFCFWTFYLLTTKYTKGTKKKHKKPSIQPVIHCYI